jgi:Flp pilus assembly CpaE family ATPase
MKLLITDRTSEGQMELAQRVERFRPSDTDSLDLAVSLTSEAQLFARLPTTDVLLLGPGLEDDVGQIARSVRSSFPHVQMILFVTRDRYSKEAFRTAHLNGIRKVLSVDSTPLDLLQELVLIQADLLSDGRAEIGRLIAFTHPKGGVGATSLCAAVGDLAADTSGRSLLVDMDWRTKDLTRALNVNVGQGEAMRRWVEGTHELSRDSFRAALHSISKHLDLVAAPDTLAASLDLMVHPEGISIMERVLDFGRLTHRNVIVDTGGDLLPGMGAVLRNADMIVVVIDDSLIGLSAIDNFLALMLPVLRNGPGSMRFVCSGTKLSRREVMTFVDQKFGLSADAWDAPVIPFDPAAAKWAGSGKTLYTLGHRNTVNSLRHLGSILGLADSSETPGGKFSVRRLLTGRSANESSVYPKPKLAAVG